MLFNNLENARCGLKAIRCDTAFVAFSLCGALNLGLIEIDTRLEPIRIDSNILSNSHKRAYIVLHFSNEVQQSHEGVSRDVNPVYIMEYTVLYIM